MEIFGSIERLMSDLYPYRYALTATSVFALALIVWLGWRRGWHGVVQRHPRAALISTVIVLAVTIPLGNYLLSPLWTRTTLVEESPLALVNAGNPAATATSAAAEPATTPAPSAGVTNDPATQATATEPASGGQAGDEMPTATPPPPGPATTAEPAQPTDTPPPPEPAATDIPSATEPEPEPADEPDPEPVAFVPHVTHSGAFHGADDFHFGQGTALIIQIEPGVYVLRFEDFSVRNGPDLRVYLSTNPDGYSDSDYPLGELKATDGSFNYDIPADVDISIYRSVIIWCEPFAVLFATAPIYPVE